MRPQLMKKRKKIVFCFGSQIKEYQITCECPSILFFRLIIYIYASIKGMQFYIKMYWEHIKSSDSGTSIPRSKHKKNVLSIWTDSKINALHFCDIWSFFNYNKKMSTKSCLLWYMTGTLIDMSEKKKGEYFFWITSNRKWCSCLYYFISILYLERKASSTQDRNGCCPSWLDISFRSHYSM